jgi:hypothetical protein
MWLLLLDQLLPRLVKKGREDTAQGSRDHDVVCR